MGLGKDSGWGMGAVPFGEGERERGQVGDGGRSGLGVIGVECCGLR